MNFSNKGISFSKLPELIAKILKNNKVRSVNFSNNFLNEKGIELIVEKLIGHFSVEMFNFSKNEIEEEIFDVMIKKFKGNKKLKTILMKDIKSFRNMPIIRKKVAILMKFNIRIEL